MTEHEKIIYFLGHIKATIEWLCHLAARDKSSDLFNFLVELEQQFNREIKNIFY